MSGNNISSNFWNNLLGKISSEDRKQYGLDDDKSYDDFNKSIFDMLDEKDGNADGNVNYDNLSDEYAQLAEQLGLSNYDSNNDGVDSGEYGQAAADATSSAAGAVSDSYGANGTNKDKNFANNSNYQGKAMDQDQNLAIAANKGSGVTNVTADSLKGQSSADLRSERSNVANDISQKRQDVQSQKQEIEDAKKKCEEDIAKKSEEKQKIVDQINNQRNTVSSLESASSAQSSAVSALRGQEPQQSSYQKDETYTDANGKTQTRKVDDTAAYNAAHSAWEAKVKAAEDKLSQIEQQLAEAQNALSELEGQLDYSEASADNYAALQTAEATNGSAVKQAEADIAQLQINLQAYDSAITTAEATEAKAQEAQGQYYLKNGFTEDSNVQADGNAIDGNDPDKTQKPYETADGQVATSKNSDGVSVDADGKVTAKIPDDASGSDETIVKDVVGKAYDINKLMTETGLSEQKVIDALTSAIISKNSLDQGYDVKNLGGSLTLVDPTTIEGLNLPDSLTRQGKEPLDDKKAKEIVDKTADQNISEDDQRMMLAQAGIDASGFAAGTDADGKVVLTKTNDNGTTTSYRVVDADDGKVSIIQTTTGGTNNKTTAEQVYSIDKPTERTLTATETDATTEPENAVELSSYRQAAILQGCGIDFESQTVEQLQDGSAKFKQTDSDGNIHEYKVVDDNGTPKIVDTISGSDGTTTSTKVYQVQAGIVNSGESSATGKSVPSISTDGVMNLDAYNGRYGNDNAKIAEDIEKDLAARYGVTAKKEDGTYTQEMLDVYKDIYGTINTDEMTAKLDDATKEALKKIDTTNFTNDDAKTVNDALAKMTHDGNGDNDSVKLKNLPEISSSVSVTKNGDDFQLDLEEVRQACKAEGDKDSQAYKDAVASVVDKALADHFGISTSNAEGLRQAYSELYSQQTDVFPDIATNSDYTSDGKLTDAGVKYIKERMAYLSWDGNRGDDYLTIKASSSDAVSGAVQTEQAEADANSPLLSYNKYAPNANGQLNQSQIDALANEFSTAADGSAIAQALKNVPGNISDDQLKEVMRKAYGTEDAASTIAGKLGTALTTSSDVESAQKALRLANMYLPDGVKEGSDDDPFKKVRTTAQDIIKKAEEEGELPKTQSGRTSGSGSTSSGSGVTNSGTGVTSDGRQVEKVEPEALDSQLHGAASAEDAAKVLGDIADQVSAGHMDYDQALSIFNGCKDNAAVQAVAAENPDALPSFFSSLMNDDKCDTVEEMTSVYSAYKGSYPEGQELSYASLDKNAQSKVRVLVAAALDGHSPSDQGLSSINLSRDIQDPLSTIGGAMAKDGKGLYDLDPKLQASVIDKVMNQFVSESQDSDNEDTAYSKVKGKSLNDYDLSSKVDDAIGSIASSKYSDFGTEKSERDQVTAVVQQILDLTSVSDVNDKLTTLQETLSKVGYNGTTIDNDAAISLVEKFSTTASQSELVALNKQLRSMGFNINNDDITPEQKEQYANAIAGAYNSVLSADCNDADKKAAIKQLNVEFGETLSSLVNTMDEDAAKALIDKIIGSDIEGNGSKSYGDFYDGYQLETYRSMVKSAASEDDGIDGSDMTRVLSNLAGVNMEDNSYRQIKVNGTTVEANSYGELEDAQVQDVAMALYGLDSNGSAKVDDKLPEGISESARQAVKAEYEKLCGVKNASIDTSSNDTIAKSVENRDSAELKIMINNTYTEGNPLRDAASQDGAVVAWNSDHWEVTRNGNTTEFAADGDTTGRTYAASEAAAVSAAGQSQDVGGEDVEAEAGDAGVQPVAEADSDVDVDSIIKSVTSGETSLPEALDSLISDKVAAYKLLCSLNSDFEEDAKDRVVIRQGISSYDIRMDDGTHYTVDETGLQKDNDEVAQRKELLYGPAAPDRNSSVNPGSDLYKAFMNKDGGDNIAYDSNSGCYYYNGVKYDAAGMTIQ